MKTFFTIALICACAYLVYEYGKTFYKLYKKRKEKKINAEHDS